uniref:EF-hand domain-containing protein n=1 Tax=Pseudo-nitzschia australis TaxID=44445 RepID=A0A7S4ANG9_9STRA|mmetsp:Transcript_9122/g.19750  ORF Transcript_9122/g.19750 Transcript_9122/m.19750 type:complete len:405 (+) Transcript_9122:434-1648(+)|eukprot:CAMPEP_0168185348 /NCGR_PEP_ID=MMETSP0139_2-20121125/13795_1 /TAXON_ID=44445 /ORGANISM="Pseudo-nitzschia australis, Strain 10249 10 AB" /LENGTH=404 /DNA_ID=CAMNT_0008107171 /DNA_START=383 /DNA_END=1597 /DNA_ORIENTATION=-
MKFGIAQVSLVCLLAANNKKATTAFSIRPHTARSITSRTTHAAASIHNNNNNNSGILRQPLALSMSTESSSPSSATEEDDEISRLRAMAQKLRSEAATLEAQQAEERASIAKLAFDKFDNNSDGKISTEELKAGLEASLKTEISQERVQKLMDKFDVSGDGYLQLEEMVSVDQFRNQLEAFSREEKRLAQEAVVEAQKEEEASKLAEAKLALLNDKDPTQTDKIVSVLPYLFPLLDSLQFGRYVILDNPENPFVFVLALLFSAYKTIPFSGFIAFIALNTLSNNPGLNKLVRFNMQQAIFLDIALFFPSLAAALFAGIGSMAGFQIPQAINQAGDTAIFGALLLVVAYASISSLLGIKPDKIPVISNAVEERMPTIDMFDDSGRFIPQQMREPKDEEDKQNKKD